MASASQIDQSVIDDINRQEQERFVTPDVVAEIDRQERLRNGDYGEGVIRGAITTALGVTEDVADMVGNFAVALPATIKGAGMAAIARNPQEAGEKYLEGFSSIAESERVSEFLDPRSEKGKRYKGVLEDTYNEYINVKWGGYVEGLLDEGRISPEEATYYKVSADALVMGLFMKGGSYLKAAGAKTAELTKPRSGRMVDLDATTEIVPAGGLAEFKADVAQKALEPRRITGPKGELTEDSIPVAVSTRAALERGVPPETIRGAIDSAKGPEEVATNIGGLIPDAAKPPLDAAPSTSDPRTIFKNRQAGAVDPEVFIDLARIVARPGLATAKQVADVTHALARQIGFKHVTDIRKINSPTAKMLADRIMPLEDSKIELGGGYHELISIKEGAFGSRLEILLEPLRKHVINKNATKSMRLVALPKQVNEDIFVGLDTGKAPEYIVPLVRALRGMLDELRNYQNEAGAEIARRPNYMKHLWDHRSIATAEALRRNGGEFTKDLMKHEGLTFDQAQEVIANITHEEGFLDFVEDAGGRLGPKQDYSEWAGRTRGIAGGAPKPQHAQHRSLTGDYSWAKKWLVTDVEAVLTSYISRAVQHAEYTRLAGKNEAKLNQTVRQIIEEQEVGGHEGGKLRANNPHTTAQEIYDMFDALQGRFHRISNPHVRRLSKGASGIAVMVHLGKVVLAQFPELMTPATKYRVATSFKGLEGIPIPLKSYAYGMVDAVQNATSAATAALGKRVIPKTEARQHLERIGVIAPSALHSSASRMAGPVGTLTNRFIRLVFLEAFTNLQRTINLDTINSMIRQNSAYLAKGKAENTKSKMYRQELTELGIKPEEAVAWYEAGMPKEHPISAKFDIAHVRGINSTTTIPTAANSPRVYNDQRFQVAIIFTRFFTAFGNTFLKHVGKKLLSSEVTNTRKIASLGSIVTTVAIAYYTQFLREDIDGYVGRDEDDPMRVVDAWDRSGLTAMFTRLYPLFSDYKYGQSDKYVLGLLGGAVGSDVAGFIAAAKGSNRERARWMAKMTPVLNISGSTRKEMEEFYLELIDGLPEGH